MNTCKISLLPFSARGLYLVWDRYIFTDFQSDNELGRQVVEEYAQAARERGCAFIPVVLSCDAAVNATRMRSDERVELVAGGKGLLLDTDVLALMRELGEIARYESPELLELDVTDVQPEEAATMIVSHMLSAKGKTREGEGATLRT